MRKIHFDILFAATLAVATAFLALLAPRPLAIAMNVPLLDAWLHLLPSMAAVELGIELEGETMDVLRVFVHALQYFGLTLTWRFAVVIADFIRGPKHRGTIPGRA
jgi:hypothetical protein